MNATINLIVAVLAFVVMALIVGATDADASTTVTECGTNMAPTEDGCQPLRATVKTPEHAPAYYKINLPEGTDPEFTAVFKRHGFYASNDDRCQCLYKLVPTSTNKAI